MEWERVFIKCQIKDWQIFSERGENTLGKEEEKDIAPLKENLEVEDIAFEDQSFASRFTDAEEWSDD